MTQNYRDHAITVLAGLDEYTGAFLPEASITWKSLEGNHMEHSLTSTTVCLTIMYALAVALDEAKVWIDERLDKPR